jgi:hypothetical protein
MAFQYEWNRDEANFGKPQKHETEGGTHISCENFLYFQGEFVALRRPKANPEHEVPEKAKNSDTPLLYFVHNLPIWGESLNDYVTRVVKEYAGVGVERFSVVTLDMEVYEQDQQWAITPHTIVEIDELPEPGNFGNEITEVITFSTDNVPDEFGWWEANELKGYLERAEKILKLTE